MTLYEDLEIKLKITNSCQEYGYSLQSLEATNRMIPKFLTMIKKYGDMYCPCHNVQNADTLCPCKYMREQGACRCGLFKPHKVEGDTK